MPNMSIDNLLKDMDLGHSELQIDSFIVGSGITDYGKYKQVLRELKSRKNTLLGLYSDKMLLEVDIEESEDKIDSKSLDKYEERREQIKLKLNLIKYKDLENTLDSTLKELNRFYAHALKLKGQLGELTENRKRELDNEYWIKKFSEQSKLEILSYGNIQKNTLESILALPEEASLGILANVKYGGLPYLLEDIKSKKVISLDNNEIEKLVSNTKEEAKLIESKLVKEDIKNT